MSPTAAIIVAKDRHDDADRRRLEADLLAALRSRPGVELIVTPHLYDLDPDGAAIETLRVLPGDLVVFAWLYPRATYWLLDVLGIGNRNGSSERSIRCFDLRAHNRPEAFLDQIAGVLEGHGSQSGVCQAIEVAEDVRQRWYPVIDRERCKNCLECANFCLFGVYGIDTSGRVMVEEPNACRPGCPACSRVCPSGAIMFPQHADPAIAGDPRFSPAGSTLDVSQLFTGMKAVAPKPSGRRTTAARKGETRDEGPEARKETSDDLDRLVDEIDELPL